jgi:hypothetical protein
VEPIRPQRGGEEEENSQRMLLCRIPFWRPCICVFSHSTFVCCDVCRYSYLCVIECKLSYSQVHKRAAERLRDLFKKNAVSLSLSLCIVIDNLCGTIIVIGSTQVDQGIYIKAGQHMACLDYLLPPEYTETMRIFQDQVRSQIRTCTCTYANAGAPSSLQ